MFPDDWEISGSLTEQYRQVGNAVPCGLGYAAAKAVVAHYLGKCEYPPADFPFSRYKNTDETSWEAAAKAKLTKKPKKTRFFFED